MTIFEHFNQVDEQIAKIYNDNLLMIQQMTSSGLDFQVRSFSGNRPMSPVHRDGMGNIIDFDHDGVPDSGDFYFGDGQFDPNSF